VKSRFFKKPKSVADTVVTADNGEERLQINNNVYRNKQSRNFSQFAPDNDIPASVEKEPEVQDPQPEQQSDIVVVVAQPQQDLKTQILLKLIDKAISLL